MKDILFLGKVTQEWFNSLRGRRLRKSNASVQAAKECSGRKQILSEALESTNLAEMLAISAYNTRNEDGTLAIAYIFASANLTSNAIIRLHSAIDGCKGFKTDNPRWKAIYDLRKQLVHPVPCHGMYQLVVHDVPMYTYDGSRIVASEYYGKNTNLSVFVQYKHPRYVRNDGLLIYDLFECIQEADAYFEHVYETIAKRKWVNGSAKKMYADRTAMYGELALKFPWEELGKYVDERLRND